MHYNLKIVPIKSRVSDITTPITRKKYYNQRKLSNTDGRIKVQYYVYGRKSRCKGYYYIEVELKYAPIERKSLRIISTSNKCKGINRYRTIKLKGVKRQWMPQDV